jgi:hypothetical protein
VGQNEKPQCGFLKDWCRSENCEVEPSIMRKYVGAVEVRVGYDGDIDVVQNWEHPLFE